MHVRATARIDWPVFPVKIAFKSQTRLLNASANLSTILRD